MGCSSTREKIEARMLILKLQRVAIKRERQQRCEELSKLTGEPVTREGIPDYEVNPIVFDKKVEEDKDDQKDKELKKSKTEQMNLVVGLRRNKTTTVDEEGDYEEDLWRNRQRSRLRHLVTRRRYGDDMDLDDNDRYPDIDDYEERRDRHDDDFIDDSYNSRKDYNDDYYDDEDIDERYKNIEDENIEEEDEDRLDVEEID